MYKFTKEGVELSERDAGVDISETTGNNWDPICILRK